MAASPRAGTKIDLMIEENEMETQREVLVNLQEGCESTRLNSIATENCYRANLERVNGTVDDFNRKYGQLLEKIRLSDIQADKGLQTCVRLFGTLLDNHG